MSTISILQNVIFESKTLSVCKIIIYKCYFSKAAQRKLFAGRAKYKFASFWNRNHACRALQRAASKFKELEVQSKQVGPRRIPIFNMKDAFFVLTEQNVSIKVFEKPFMPFLIQMEREFFFSYRTKLLSLWFLLVLK